jgi:hypothetical protein
LAKKIANICWPRSIYRQLAVYKGGVLEDSGCLEHTIDLIQMIRENKEMTGQLAVLYG